MRPLYGLAVLTAVFLSACGQTGALYLPESNLPKPNPTTQTTASPIATTSTPTGVTP